MICGFLNDSLGADALFNLTVAAKLLCRHQSPVGWYRQSSLHPQVFDEEGPHVGGFFNQLGRGLARPVPCPGFDPD